MGEKYNVEVQDENGNVYHPHSNARVIFRVDGVTPIEKSFEAIETESESFEKSLLRYATCSTAAGTAAKVVTVSAFKLETGAFVKVKFSNTNTANNPTLNINSSGAKAIYYKGAAISASLLIANVVFEFVYNGNQYDLVGIADVYSKSEIDTRINSLTNSDIEAAAAIAVLTSQQDKMVQEMTPVDITLSAPTADNTVPAAIATATAITSILQTIWNKLLHLYNSKANLASPAFTGTPTAATAAQTVNNSQLATTQYVQTAVTTKPTRNSFAAATGVTTEGAYYKSSDGIVVVNIVASFSANRTHAEAIATLPAGYRPFVYLIFPATYACDSYDNIAGTGAPGIAITAGGAIWLMRPPSNAIKVSALCVFMVP